MLYFLCFFEISIEIKLRFIDTNTISTNIRFSFLQEVKQCFASARERNLVGKIYLAINKEILS